MLFIFLMVIFLKMNYILFWKVGVKRIYMIKVLYDYFFSLKIEQIRYIAVKVNLVILLHFFFSYFLAIVENPILQSVLIHRV